MRSLILMVFLFIGSVELLDAQEREALQIRVVAVSAGPDSEFSQQQLVDAVTVLLAAKMPEVRLVEPAPLWLYVVPNCLQSTQGYTCSIDLSLEINLSWPRPFGQRGRLVLWREGSILRGPPGESFSHIRRRIEEELGSGVAAWRRFGPEQQECWTRFMNAPVSSIAWRDIDAHLLEPSAQVVAQMAMLRGPCVGPWE